MCIRDRLLADIYKSDKDFENRKQERYSDDLYKQDRENTIELLQNEFKSIKLEPVSYTHLRAHETVLDLVCRLLLEKKTK